MQSNDSVLFDRSGFKQFKRQQNVLGAPVAQDHGAILKNERGEEEEEEDKDEKEEEEEEEEEEGETNPERQRNKAEETERVDRIIA